MRKSKSQTHEKKTTFEWKQAVVKIGAVKTVLCGALYMEKLRSKVHPKSTARLLETRIRPTPKANLARAECYGAK